MNFLNIPNEFSDAGRSAVHIIPVPYDMTSTYHKGADNGPQAIIDASAQLEWYDIQTESQPHLTGIYTQEPIVCSDPDPTFLAPLVSARVSTVFKDGKLPVVLGGEHSVSIGAMTAAKEYYPDLSILQIDAHGDSRDSYMDSTHNHACVMARAKELAPVVQIGIRSIDESERQSLDLDRTYFAHEILNSANDDWIDRAIAQLTGHVYLTIDLDAFDPSIIPSTGTPEPGGLDWRIVNELIARLCRSTSVVGFDVVELCPNKAHHASDFTAAKLVLRTIAEIQANAKTS